MNNTEIFARARRLINVNSTQWTDIDLLIDVNVAYHDMLETIINRVAEDFFNTTFTADTVIWQSGYDLQIADATTEWYKKVKRISVKYKSTDEYFTVLKEVAFNWLELSKEYYAENTSPADAFYYLDWNQVMIFPEPSEEIVGWIRIETSVTAIDLVVGGAEALNKIPRQFHSILVQWTLQFQLQHLWKINEKNDAINEYQNLKNDMVTELSDRNSAPIMWLLPNLSHLE